MKALLIGVMTFFVLTCAGLAAAPAGAETMAVIVSKNNPIASLSMTEIRRIYQDEMVRWPGGEKIEVYDLPVDNPGRVQFSRRVIGKAAERVASEWANKKITNTAKNPPKIVKSKVLMLYKVGKSRLAIGYLPLAMVKGKPKVKVMATID